MKLRPGRALFSAVYEYKKGVEIALPTWGTFPFFRSTPEKRRMPKLKTSRG